MASPVRFTVTGLEGSLLGIVNWPVLVPVTDPVGWNTTLIVQLDLAASLPVHPLLEMVKSGLLMAAVPKLKLGFT